MILQFWGAAQEVTGSKHLLIVNGKKILLDCGLFQGHRQEADEKNRNHGLSHKDVDLILLSHAHIDHSGLLPHFVKDGFTGPIYATLATRDLCNVMLQDCAYIQQKDAEWINRKLAKLGQKALDPLYAIEDVLNTMNQFHGVNYLRPVTVAPGVQATWFDAGHILGSAYIRLDIEEEGKHHVLVFSGDLGRKNLPILRDPTPYPLDTEYLITESTYGHRFHKPVEDMKEDVYEVVKATYDMGGKVIIPAFSVERTQELVYILHQLEMEGRIPNIPVFVDSPLSGNATEIFKMHPECYDRETYDTFLANQQNPFGFGKLHYITSVEESKSLNTREEPCIIISASGMCENGRIVHHLANNLSNPKNTLLVVGYMADGTLGRKIIDGENPVNIFGQPVPVRANIRILDSFSGHADRRELEESINPLSNLKQAFVVHGEAEQAQALSQFIVDTKKIPVAIPRCGEQFEIR